MAIVLFEKGKGEVVTAPVIRSEIGGGRVQISGRMTTPRPTTPRCCCAPARWPRRWRSSRNAPSAPAWAPRTSARASNSVTWGFAAIACSCAPTTCCSACSPPWRWRFNLLLLVALLSMLQATLTLPGIAAIALTLGMAIDANVLINERMREELRAGVSAAAAIHTGYERAWGTILDSNVTTLIAGLALLAFGSGPVRGFAVVHCLGILTSMFSAVVFSRAWSTCGTAARRKLKSVSIGQVWKPVAPAPAASSTSRRKQEA
jgi:preprotein translocase subunit SecD